MSKYKVCRGCKDLMPSDYKKYDFLKNEIEQIGNVYGYKMVKTCCIDDSELFSSCYRSDIENKLLSINNRFTNSVSLNYDSTISTLRSIVENKLYVDKSLPLKFMYLKEQFNYDKKDKGNVSKYYYGFECVGDKSVYLDVESVLLSFKVLNYLGLVNYNLRVKNIGENKDYYCNFLQSLTNLSIDYEEDSSIDIKPYYTGIAYCIDVNEYEDVIVGGRYDSLVNDIGGVSVGVVGSHIDFEKMIKICDSEEKFPSFKEEIDFYIIPKSEKVFKYALYISELLRDLGALVEIHYKEYDLKRLDDLLNRVDVTYSVVIDEDNERKETIIVRNSLNKLESEVKLKDFIKDLEQLDEHHHEEEE